MIYEVASHFVLKAIVFPYAIQRGKQETLQEC